MAKELMEIGGFITEGAEIVNHDNTLSGNGTVDSPLGVVPGYNETVLWSGNTSHITAGQTWTASLNEPVSNFEKIGILLSHSYGWGIAAAPGNPLEMRETYINSGVAYWTSLDDLKPSINNAGGNAPQYDAGLAYASGNKITCVGYGRYQVTTAGNLSTTVANNRGVTILEIVGINRKA